MLDLRSREERLHASLPPSHHFDPQADYMDRALANLSLYDATHSTAPESVGDSSDISASCSESPPTAFTCDNGQTTYDKCRVYLGGLPDDVTTEWLESYGNRFGRVRDCRVIDAARGPPSGIVRFDDAFEAQRCIDHATHIDRIDASFARVNIRRELRAHGDTNSTNLYIANLPSSWDETDLVERLFPAPFIVKSCRILREGDRSGRGQSNPPAMRGPSRGVGFCRLETREQCDKAIQRLAGSYLPGSALPLQIRYADTPDQRRIKSIANDLTPPVRSPNQSSTDLASMAPHSPIMCYNSLPPAPIVMPTHYTFMPMPYHPPPPFHSLPPVPLFTAAHVPRFSPPSSPMGYIPQTSLFPVGLPGNLPGPPSPPGYAPWAFPSPSYAYDHAFNGPRTSTGIVADEKREMATSSTKSSRKRVSIG